LFVEIASSPTVRLSRLGGFSAELCYATGVTYPKPALFSARDIPDRLQQLLNGLLLVGNNHYVPIAANLYKKATADFYQIFQLSFNTQIINWTYYFIHRSFSNRCLYFCCFLNFYDLTTIAYTLNQYHVPVNELQNCVAKYAHLHFYLYRSSFL